MRFLQQSILSITTQIKIKKYNEGKIYLPLLSVSRLFTGILHKYDLPAIKTLDWMSRLKRVDLNTYLNLIQSTHKLTMQFGKNKGQF